MIVGWLVGCVCMLKNVAKLATSWRFVVRGETDNGKAKQGEALAVGKG